MTEAAAYPRFKTEAGKARYLAAYQAALQTWPVPYEDRQIATRFGPTHVVVSGPPDAPSVVLLPSFAASATVWRANVAALSQRFRVLAVDVIGQPGRSWAERPMRSRGDYAAWLGEVMDGLGAPRAALVGCSFGGFLALSQAALTPERVTHVAMISPAGTFVGLSWRVTVTMLTGPWRRRLRKLLGDKRPPNVARLSGPAVPPKPEDAAWRAQMGVTMAEGAKVSIINAGVLGRRDLARVRARTLLLIGEHERLYDPAATLALARSRLPGLEAEIIPAADHIGAMANPDWVNQRLLEFLG